MDIPEVFYIYNDLLMYGDAARSKQFYAWLDEKTRADQCIECGERSEYRCRSGGKVPQACGVPLSRCPVPPAQPDRHRGIDIPEWMKTVQEVLRSESRA